MLFLTLQMGESVVVGGSTVKVDRLKNGAVVLGVQADKEVRIDRLARNGKPFPKRMRNPL